VGVSQESETGSSVSACGTRPRWCCCCACCLLLCSSSACCFAAPAEARELEGVALISMAGGSLVLEEEEAAVLAALDAPNDRCGERLGLPPLPEGRGEP
jgi:hypothetical protein